MSNDVLRKKLHMDAVHVNIWLHLDKMVTDFSKGNVIQDQLSMYISGEKGIWGKP